MLITFDETRDYLGMTCEDCELVEAFERSTIPPASSRRSATVCPSRRDNSKVAKEFNVQGSTLAPLGNRCVIHSAIYRLLMAVKKLSERERHVRL